MIESLFAWKIICFTAHLQMVKKLRFYHTKHKQPKDQTQSVQTLSVSIPLSLVTLTSTHESTNDDQALQTESLAVTIPLSLLTRIPSQSPTIQSENTSSNGVLPCLAISECYSSPSRPSTDLSSNGILPRLAISECYSSPSRPSTDLSSNGVLPCLAISDCPSTSSTDLSSNGVLPCLAISDSECHSSPSTSSTDTSSNGALPSLAISPISSSTDMSTTGAFSHQYCSTLNDLNYELKRSDLPAGWSIVEFSSSNLILCDYFVKYPPIVKYTISVSDLLTWSLCVFGQEVDIMKLFPDQPHKLDSLFDLLSLLQHLNNLCVCSGNTEQEIIELAVSKKGIFHNGHGKYAIAQVAFNIDLLIIFTGVVVAKLHDFPWPTVKHVNCRLLLDGNDSQQCSSCKTHRKTLLVQLSRQKKQSSSSVNTSSHKNFRFMHTPEKIEVMRQMRKNSKSQQLKFVRLEKNLEVLMEKRGVYIDETVEKDLHTIVETNSASIESEFPDDSFQKLFWQQQMNAVKTSPRGRRWHPAFIKYCLFLRHKSSGAYELLRTSGCLQLPSQRTLRDYTHYVKSSPGFNTEIDSQLIKMADVASLNEHERHVCLLLDEMHVKDDLVYDKWTGEIIGFTNLGDITTHLSKVEREFSRMVDESEPDIDIGNEESTATLATSVLTFMVRGLFINLQFPYATFPCNATSAEQLIVLFIEAIFRIERCGLRVIVTTCDSFSANRKFYLLIGTPSSKKGVVYKARNPVSRTRNIFLFCDPPHLLKTARNCFSNPKRSMKVNIITKYLFNNNSFIF